MRTLQAMRLSLIFSLLLTGCATQSWNCTEYGVANNFHSMGRLTAVSELPDSEVEEICGAGFIGCAINWVDTVRIYYRTGDECAFRHELCHVMHGHEHTTDYDNDTSARRTCPG